MITRYLSSATAGVVVTTGLLYVMQMLIASGEQVWTDEPRRIPITWIHVDPVGDSDIPPPPPEPPPLPLEPPLSAPPAEGYPLGSGIGISSPAPPPPEFRRQNTGFSMGDGPLVADEAISLGEGVIYPVLHGLERNGALRAKRKAVGGRTRVYYSLTAKGRRRLERLQGEWQRIQSGITAALGAPGHA